MCLPIASRPVRSLAHRLKQVVRAIENDEQAVLDRVVELSRRRRLFAPLAFTVGAFAMLLDGLRLLIANWRLTLVQVLPAVWIWLAMYDLRAKVLYGKSLPQLRGAVLVPIALAVVAITVASFFLNAVFAFAIADEHPPRIRPAFEAARARVRVVCLWGVAIGTPLAIVVTVGPRWQKPWFALSLGVVIGLMMICYVAVPGRLIGMRPRRSRRERVTGSLMSTALSATVCTPPYLLGRLGILMLGSKALFVPGVVLLIVGFGLQAGATGAVRAIKMSLSLRPRHKIASS